MTAVDVALRWIDGARPDALPRGATLGAPLPRGAVRDIADLDVVAAGGQRVPAQFWPLATWPDGSVKWTGVAIGATEHPCDGYRVVSGAPRVAHEHATVNVASTADALVVDTGGLVAEIPRSGAALIRSLVVDGREVARDGRLLSSRQTHPKPDWTTRKDHEGRTTHVEVEQHGPIRAVVRLEGEHVGRDGRGWLPFTVRLVFLAGARTVRLVHSVIWDGDPDRDFLSSLGITFDVPLDVPRHDRHVRFADAEGGVLREAVHGITGLRRDPGKHARDAQLAGRATDAPSAWADDVGALMRWVPAWPDYSLRQLSPNAYSIAKRTNANRPWIDVAHGRRAAGFASLSTPRGGLGIGLRDFWQSYPTGIDIDHADADAGSLTLWLWSPDAAPMDMRFYHDGLGEDTYRQQLEALEITYEDYEHGLGSAHGIARTHEIDIVAYTATPSAAQTAADAAHASSAAPRLAPTPTALRTAHAFGDWDLPDRSTPARAALEDRLEAILDFYLGQVDQRSWYGFWNYGDIMHTYDADRHTWRYDVGGFAWDNSELASDLWLWTSFARSGRGDVFRMAEAMARHTGDVDRYHAGPLKGLGTRHNVQHWGCGCKQLRIGSAAFRRPHYFLTADEHSRDLLLSLRDSEATFLALDPSRKARPDEHPAPAPVRERIQVALGPDWGALASAWLASWEITGDEHARDKLLDTMRDIAAFPHGFLHGHARLDIDTGRLRDPAEPHLWHLTAIFGLVELCAELIDLVDDAGFRDAWLEYCRLYLATPAEHIRAVGTEMPGNLFPQWHSRLLARYAHDHDDDALAKAAWRAYFAGGEVTPVDLGEPTTVSPPFVLRAVDELRISTNDAAQSSLAAIQNLALIGQHLS